MSWLLELKARILALFRGGAMDRERAEEMRYHLEEAVRRNMDRGMQPDEARRQALLAFGGIENTKEMCRDERGTRLLEDLLQDLHYGLNQLRRSPGFSLCAILTLALGIGANTAVFGIVNAVLVRPLPFARPDRLVLLGGIPLAEYRTDWFNRDHLFESLAGFETGTLIVTEVNEAERVVAAQVTAPFLATLGISPAVGRDFGRDEQIFGANDVAIISSGFAQRHFGGPKEAVGKRITLSNKRHVIIGVLPPGVRFPDECDVWVPSNFDFKEPWGLLNNPEQITVSGGMIGRLKEGVTTGQALASVQALQQLRGGILRRRDPRSGVGSVNVLPFHEFLVRSARTSLLLLLGSVGLVLLVACVNVANLLLARSHARAHELSVRAALGAGKARLIRQLLTEGVLIAAIGGCAGVAIAFWSIPIIRNLAPAGLPGLYRPVWDLHVLAFTSCVSLAVGIVSGLAPALRVSSLEPGLALHAGHLQSSTGRLRVRNALIATEVAASVVLLAGAGLFIKSLALLHHVDPGFRPEGTLAMEISLPTLQGGSSLEERQQHWLRRYRELLQRLRAIYGVQSAATASQLPFDPRGPGSMGFHCEGTPTSQDGMAVFTTVSEDYFSTVGVSLIKGRTFTEQEVMTRRPLAIVNDSLVRRVWPDENPIGKRIKVGWNDWREVVGVVGTVKYSGLDEPDKLQIYAPGLGSRFVIRGSRDMASLIGDLRAAVKEFDPNAPVAGIKSMQERMAAWTAPPRLRTILFGSMASLALALSAVGISGVMSQLVNQSRHEIGIRMALGATRRQIAAQMIRRGLLSTALGILLGLTTALNATALLKKLLFRVEVTDPAPFAGAVILLILVAVAAALVPVRRAAKTDPIDVLRAE